LVIFDLAGELYWAVVSLFTDLGLHSHDQAGIAFAFIPAEAPKISVNECRNQHRASQRLQTRQKYFLSLPRSTVVGQSLP